MGKGMGGEEGREKGKKEGREGGGRREEGRRLGKIGPQGKENQVLNAAMFPNTCRDGKENRPPSRRMEVLMSFVIILGYRGGI